VLGGIFVGIECATAVAYLIIKELCSKHDGSNNDTVYVQLSQQEVVPLNQTIDVNQCKDETLSGARGVLMDALKVGKDGDGRWLEGMESRDDTRVHLSDLSVRGNKAFQNGG